MRKRNADILIMHLLLNSIKAIGSHETVLYSVQAFTFLFLTHLKQNVMFLSHYIYCGGKNKPTPKHVIPTMFKAKWIYSTFPVRSI